MLRQLALTVLRTDVKVLMRNCAVTRLFMRNGQMSSMWLLLFGLNEALGDTCADFHLHLFCFIVEMGNLISNRKHMR